MNLKTRTSKCRFKRDCRNEQRYLLQV